LCSKPKLAQGAELSIGLLDGFFKGQFKVNEQSQKCWQVFDRTEEREIKSWSYNPETGEVLVTGATAWHQYTASFFAWRVWEEISMYNHTTNHWESEPLMQLDPIYPEARAYLVNWLKKWCEEHPKTAVVRFTSLFYNFAWIWGADDNVRSLFSDWASYDFSASPRALELFEKAYGYSLTAEDFVRKGRYNATHRPPTQRKLDWMEFVGSFCRTVARELTDIVHSFGKKAYVFYDDSWIGLEPYSGHFSEFGFDGLIKCVFSGYEARLCAGVPDVKHELRFHPYLFPIGLGGAPTFSKGGDPAGDLTRYWVNIRRALLRAKVDRTGLGGYPHLVEGHPDFIDRMSAILAEFRKIASLHDNGGPLVLPVNVAILTSWGKLRTWTLSGHFHETDSFCLIHILEALSGLPVNVSFVCYSELENGVDPDLNVIICAGKAGDAWSGAGNWNNPNVVASLTKWTHDGGIFLGVDEPSALPGYSTYMRMSHVLGLDLDDGEMACHGKLPVKLSEPPFNVPDKILPAKPCVCITSRDTKVLALSGDSPALTVHPFGQGKGVYLSGFAASIPANRFLLDILLYATQVKPEAISSNPLVECAVFPHAIAFVNSSQSFQKVACSVDGRVFETMLSPFDLKVVDRSSGI
jgi:beta-D-galactosyl-(1->4)-L-rhamnose phosphorylase